MKQALVVCHRGACRFAPENTLASLERAIDLGAEVVEFDVRASKDGVLYVLHDATLNRTTDGNGRVSDLLSSEIDELDAGSWFSAEFAGERVPRLEMFLDACRGRIGTCVDIKEADPAEIRDMLAVRGMLNDAWMFSVDQSIRAEARAKVPDFRRMVQFAHVGSVERAVAQNAHVLEFHEGNLSEHLVAEARAANLITQIFYPGNDRAIFDKAIRCGIDQVNIDHVDLYRDVQASFMTPAA